MPYIDMPEPYEFEGMWQEGGTHQTTLFTEEFDPVFTGLLSSDGHPIMRHPVRMRIGFHREEDKFHVPTLEDSDEEFGGAIVGWTYAV